MNSYHSPEGASERRNTEKNNGNVQALYWALQAAAVKITPDPPKSFNSKDDIVGFIIIGPTPALSMSGVEKAPPIPKGIGPLLLVNPAPTNNIS